MRDRDWLGLLNPEPDDPRLFLTDLYDLDATVILLTDAGRRVAEVFAESDALADWTRRHPEHSVISAAVAVAAPVGRLRLASERGSLGIRSEGTPLRPPVVDNDWCLVDLTELVTVAVSRSGAVRHEIAQIHACVVTEAEKVPDDHRLCCGHDLARALAGLIANPWCGAQHGASFLLQAIRAAVSRDEFMSLSFVDPIERWANSQGSTAWRGPQHI
ncbi:MAG: hypothetical protein AAGF73_16470 [Actinomycetota bacterium]